MLLLALQATPHTDMAEPLKTSRIQSHQHEQCRLKQEKPSHLAHLIVLALLVFV